MDGYLVGSAMWVVTLIVAFRIAQATVRTPDVVRQIHALHQQVQAWQSAHDHHIAELDRRMRGVEEAAARAETEARMVATLVTSREATS